MLKKNFNFPAQTGTYAVKVKGGDDWKQHDSCRLHISVGQPYHEGDKLEALVEWARPRFPHVIVCVNDTLQGFTRAFEKGISRPQSYYRSLNAGDEWIDRNQSALQGVDVRRWESWKTWPEYPRAYAKLVKLFDENQEFRDGLTGTINRFWERREGKHPAYISARKEEFYAISSEYLLEEVAVICRMIETERAIDIYPGSMLQVFDILKNKEIANAPAGLTQRDFARVDFSRNANFALAL